LTESAHADLMAVAVSVGVVAVFLVAARRRRADPPGRTMNTATAAVALSGEYLSGAVFLGYTGLALSYGVRALWFTLGSLAGFVLLIALVAAPLRRSGAYTLSDFTEWRLRSRKVRRVTSASVCFAAWIYLLPQFRGASRTLHLALGAPAWLGPAFVTVLVLALVVFRRMRRVSAGQAFQYWLRLVALAVPVLTVLIVWHGPAPETDSGQEFVHRTQVTVTHDARIGVAAPVTAHVDGRLDDHLRDADVRLTPGTHLLGSGSRVTFPAGARMPHAERATPLYAAAMQDDTRWCAVYGIYSLIIALALGTMGLPYLVLRLHTVPSAGAARRTALGAIGLVAVFFWLPPLYAFMDRHTSAGLAVLGAPDAAILTLPARLLPGVGGQILTAVLVAGLLCAFLSGATAIVLAVGATISQSLFGGGVRSFRLGALIALAVPLGMLVCTTPLSPGTVVLMAFTVVAASLCPLLILGMWWRRLTGVGAAAGMIAGGGLTVACAVLRLSGHAGSGWWSTIIARPALVTVPIGFGVMWLGSVLTRRRIPDGVPGAMARMHLPEEIAARARDRR